MTQTWKIESVVSEVMLSGEVTVEPVTIESKEKEEEPVSMGLESEDEDEAVMSVKEEGIIGVPPSDGDGADKTAVSSDKRGGDVRDGDLVGVAAGKKPGVPPADYEEQKAHGEAVKEKILLKRARATEGLTFCSRDILHRT